MASPETAFLEHESMSHAQTPWQDVDADVLRGPDTAERRAHIAQRAYELFEERGFAHGHDVEDWLQAERELTAV